ncbi:hypothetical protein OG912_16890 [Streptomyces sp. NBC_00464]|uniref:hypothetical protein n=1 Tax=Streptomyces sp. NBC_00464 TaxID=2975751 RepID=UPI002E19BD27
MTLSEPTDRTQPDEGLRRAQAEPDTTTRTLLLRIATRLSTERPSLAMREVTRLALALRFATEQHGFDTPETNTAEQQLLRHMPQVDDRDISRGEYALLLRGRAGRRATPTERVAELHRQARADYACRSTSSARTALATARIHGNEAGGTR